jgi:hypothetical protein
MSSGGARRGSGEQAALQQRNLLLICGDVLSTRAARSLPLAAVRVAAAVLAAAPAAQLLLAQLYYNRGEWHRLARLQQGDSDPAEQEESLRALCRARLARNTHAAEPEDHAALLWLLKAEEVKGLGSKSKKKKEDSGASGGSGQWERGGGWGGGGKSRGGGGLEKLKGLAALLQDMRGPIQPSPLWAELSRRLGSCAALTAATSDALWQIHLLFFTLANYTPDEAVGMLTRDIGSIPVPTHVGLPSDTLHVPVTEATAEPDLDLVDLTQHDTARHNTTPHDTTQNNDGVMHVCRQVRTHGSDARRQLVHLPHRLHRHCTALGDGEVGRRQQAR